MKSHSKEALDPVRSLIQNRANELNVSMAQLSRECGKNLSFLNSYFKRGVPKVLSLPDRVAMARALDLDESLLCAPGQGPSTPSSLAVPSGLELLPRLAEGAAAPDAIDVPLFHDTDDIEPAAAHEWARRPSNVPFIGGMVALIVTQGCTRTRPGDTLYAAKRPARVGDLAVCLRGNRVAAVGEIAHIDADIARVTTGSGLRTIELAAGTQIMKVTTVITA